MPPLPELQSAARYGPTIFPVAFAAVIGAFLTNYAAWRLERGISMLSLEHLLSTRTVFGAVLMPFSLRSANLLAPLLFALWALSPIGGQAALRVIEVKPWTQSEPWGYQYLDVMSRQRVCSPTSSSGMELMPAIVGAFNAALATPGSIKNESKDAFGNLKIPMIESCLKNGGKPDQDGWVDTMPSDCAYASIIGLSLQAEGPVRGFGFANFTFNLETSYTYSDCSLNHTLAGPNETWADWYTSLVNKTDVNNGITLGISLLGLDTSFRNDSQQLPVESITSNAKTQATCSLSQTYVETEVFCNHDDCAVQRIRNSNLPHNATYYLPLHGQWGDMSVAMPCAAGIRGFLAGLVKSSMFMSMYGSTSATDPYSTPLEYYMVNPDLPYSAYSAEGSTWRGADIYPIGASVFSERFAQLWNTWWLSNIAPEAAMGENERKFNGYTWNYNVVNTTGTMTPDFMQLRCNKGWLAALIIASVVMLGASIANIIVGLLQTRPDILYRVSVLVRDNPQTVATYADHVQRRDAEVRMKDVHLSLRDGDGKGGGYAKVRTVDDDASRA
ncbi:hypothetical protein G6514_009001 [Epicoccum nigrum]|nr:hypothetical protein G6514_009001 [Epicoccum nigrum]